MPGTHRLHRSINTTTPAWSALSFTADGYTEFEYDNSAFFAVSGNGKRVAWIDAKTPTTVYVTNVETKQSLAILPLDTMSGNICGMSADGRLVFLEARQQRFLGSPSMLYVIRINADATQVEYVRHFDDIPSGSFCPRKSTADLMTPDGLHIMYNHLNDQVLRVYNIETNVTTRVDRGTNPAARPFGSFSSDGKYAIIMENIGGAIYVYNMTNGDSIDISPCCFLSTDTSVVWGAKLIAHQLSFWLAPEAHWHSDFVLQILLLIDTSSTCPTRTKSCDTT